MTGKKIIYFTYNFFDLLIQGSHLLILGVEPSLTLYKSVVRTDTL